MRELRGKKANRRKDQAVKISHAAPRVATMTRRPICFHLEEAHRVDFCKAPAGRSGSTCS